MAALVLSWVEFGVVAGLVEGVCEMVESECSGIWRGLEGLGGIWKD